MSSSPPTTLGQYQIIREIARSNDIVYEAYDPLMNRRVAVKELAMPQGATSQQQTERISRFKREAQAAGTLNHPNIMTVYSFAEDAGRTFMAMEYLDGGTLRNEIDTKGFVPVDRAIDIAFELLNGLEHAHSKGVIHRDIKPDNIQILSEGQIKITDFGIARLTFQPNLTMDGQVFGTPSYMSPEQVVGKDIDARSDLFSVGVVLYEMISGQKPFAGDSVVSITYAIMNKEPDQPTQMSYPLWQVVSRALDKSPAMRYGNATEMILALKDVIQAQSSGAMSIPDPGQTQYSPYGMPAPPYVQQNPYIQAQPQAAPPIVYPYNPYQQGAPQMANPQMGFMPPPMQGGYPMQQPVFYPPPPRQPLMKPDTVIFLKRTLVAVIVLGTLFFLIVVGVNAIATSMNRDAKAKETSISKQDAIRLTSQANNYVQNGNYEQAESAYSDAVSKAPDLVEPRIGRASLLESNAKQQKENPSLSYALWEHAGEDWKAASDGVTSAQLRDTYAENGARCLYMSALAMRETQTSSQTVRDTLYTAKSMAPNNSGVRQQIADLLSEMQ